MDSESLNKSNIAKYQNIANKWITKYWFILNLLFIVCYVLYVFLKLYKVKIFSNNNVEFISSFSLSLFIINVVGFSLLAIALIYGKGFKFWQYITIIFLGFILITISYIKTLDPNLQWYGSDVAIGNYISAEETVKYGTFDLIKTWNDRANPYDYNHINDDVKDSSRKFIAKYNLSGFIFDKWKNKLDSTKYNLKTNNRPYVHSPFTSLTMGWWLKIFPFGRWSLEYEMLFINILTILIVILYARKKDIGNFRNIVILSIVSSPIMFRFHSPSIDQLSTLLFTIPIFLFLLYPSKNFWYSFLYGIIYGFCFYSKFTVLFFIIFLVFSFLFYIKDLTLKPLLGLLAGLIIPVILFTASGYYFWLTLITGRIITAQYAQHNPANLFENLTKFLYFGPSFLLLSLMPIININKLVKKNFSIYVPIIISLFFMVLFLYDQNGWNRYLGQFMPAILLFILSMEDVIELKKRDLFISLLANFIFLHLNIYF
jgi:hypothetical protein